MRKASPQSGNVFVFILLGVILFAALVFVFSRGLDTGATRMTAAKSRTAASDIINYAQSVERATGRLLQNSISESDLSFENAMVSGYAHTPAAADQAQIFNTASGGGLSWSTPSDGQTIGSSTWFITGDVVVTGQEDDNLSELLLSLPVPYDVCIEINKQLNAGVDLGSSQGSVPATKFIGTYADSALVFVTPGAGITAGCFSGLIQGAGQTGDYSFFKVLVAR